jgi:hypothetical protein
VVGGWRNFPNHGWWCISNILHRTSENKMLPLYTIELVNSWHKKWNLNLLCIRTAECKIFHSDANSLTSKWTLQYRKYIKFKSYVKCNKKEQNSQVKLIQKCMTWSMIIFGVIKCARLCQAPDHGIPH